MQLELFSKDVGTLRNPSYRQQIDQATEAVLDGVLEGCSRQLEKLDHMIQSLIPAPNSSTVKRTLYGFRSVRKERKYAKSLRFFRLTNRPSRCIFVDVMRKTPPESLDLSRSWKKILIRADHRPHHCPQAIVTARHHLKTLVQLLHGRSRTISGKARGVLRGALVAFATALAISPQWPFLDHGCQPTSSRAFFVAATAVNILTHYICFEGYA
jgi:hypothetical protein